MKYFVLVALFSFTAISAAFAVPAQVLIIRHAEKINDENPHLSSKGRKRAEALAEFFATNPSVTSFGVPVAIFAAAPKKEGKSVRPQETIAPTAQRLNVKLNLDYQKDDIKKLVNDILEERAYEGKTVVISWVNDEIPKLARKFGAKDAPKDWESDTFDRVWKITFKKSGKVDEFTDLPQKLLPGDSAE